MNKQLSIYLDGLRFLASVAVFFAHVPGFMGGYLWQLGGGGHLAVVFFFVLSGFVISFVTSTKERDVMTYAVNRLARIYSVAGPAILLTIASYYFIGMVDPDSFAVLKATLYEPLTTIASAAFFLNQSWREVVFFTNGPYWSLGYEVLYYIFFGVVLYATGLRRIFFALLILVAMGPSIALYLPVWFLGWWSYRVAASSQMSLRIAQLLFWLSLSLFVLLPATGLISSIDAASMRLMNPHFNALINMNAKSFVSDYILAVLSAVNFVAFSTLGRSRAIFGPMVANVIKKLSAHTFSIYLYHMPLLYAVTAMIPHKKYAVLNMLLCLVLTPLTIYGLSIHSEGKKANVRHYLYRLLRGYETPQSH